MSDNEPPRRPGPSTPRLPRAVAAAAGSVLAALAMGLAARTPSGPAKTTAARGPALNFMARPYAEADGRPFYQLEFERSYKDIPEGGRT